MQNRALAEFDGQSVGTILRQVPCGGALGTRLGSPNPAMEGAVGRYAWTGAFIGSVVRPLGGWMSDKSRKVRFWMVSKTFGIVLRVIG